MYTEERLFTYLQHFERDFARTKTRIIDATEGGAMKRGATSMSLADAIAQYCTRPLTIGRCAHPGLRWDRLAECAGSLEARRSEAKQVEQISRETLPLLEEVRDNLSDQSRVNRAIGKLDLLRARIAQLGRCYGLIMQLTQNSELDRFRADQQISASKAEGTDRQRRQVERDIANVRSVVDASQAFQQLMEQTIFRVDEFRAMQREAA